MSILVADLIRGLVTNIMFMVLLLSVAEPKFSKKWTWILIAAIAVANNVLSGFFYLRENYTIITKINIVILLIVSLGAKVLFKESIMQWLFNIFTVINFYASIIIISYLLSRYAIYPQYAVTLIRFIMFVGLYFLFARRLKPLYRMIIEHWKTYFILCFGVFINLVYYLFFNDDIKVSMQQNAIPLLLIIAMQIFTYVSIFSSLKSNASEYALREESLQNHAQQKLLQTELAAYDDFIGISKQNVHDIRHHNAIIAEYLEQGDLQGAREYLNDYNKNISSGTPKEFCKNKVANAIFRLYERRTSEAGVSFAIHADLPEEIPLSAPELGIVISNLLENALEACAQTEDKKMAFLCTNEESSLHIEIRNSKEKNVVFQSGFPISTKEIGGLGTKSVANIIEKHGGMLNLKQTDREYFVQIVLPIQ